MQYYFFDETDKILEKIIECESENNKELEFICQRQLFLARFGPREIGVYTLTLRMLI